MLVDVQEIIEYHMKYLGLVLNNLWKSYKLFLQLK